MSELPPLADRYKKRPADQASVAACWETYTRLAAGHPEYHSYRSNNDIIAREQNRFDRAQRLIRDGRLEDARRVWWWPANQDPPKVHWTSVPTPPCSCGRRSPHGAYALCWYCSGCTSETPSLVRRGRNEDAL